MTYEIARNGLATSFAESEVPLSYATRYENRFANAAGGAEKRQGMVQFGNDIEGNPVITGIHELVEKDGSETIFVSDGRRIYKKTASAYSTVFDTSAAEPGNFPLRSVQMGNKHIFYNGKERNLFTEDGVKFETLQARVEEGTLTSAFPNNMGDTEIADWTVTNVVTNDVIFFPKTGASGLITEVTAAGLNHTAISAGGQGLGSFPVTEVGDRYVIIDTVALNIIGSAAAIKDNVFTLAAGSSAAEIRVSGLDFTTTDVRVGDYIRNTTRALLTSVQTITSSALGVNSLALQVSGDSVVFLKSAMPISSDIHIHYGHAYHADSRDGRIVQISGLDDPQDMTSSGAGTFDFGTQQSEGDVIKAIGSYQQFLVLGGQRNVHLYKGIVPAGDGKDLVPIALFPQGIVSRDGLQTTGNDLVFVSLDGMQASTQVKAADQVQRDGISFAINRTLRDEIQMTAETEIILTHYRRRSWLILKVGTLLHIYNYATQVDERGRTGSSNVTRGAITDFNGKFARQKVYFERRNGDLLVAGSNPGKVYLFDSGFDDDGEVYMTTYQPGHLLLSEPKKDIRIKAGRYIKPIIEVGVNTTYTITAEAGYNAESREVITVIVSGNVATVGAAVIPFVIGGSSVVNKKHSLRWRGEVMRPTFTTEDDTGPDILARYSIYATKHGAR